MIMVYRGKCSWVVVLILIATTQKTEMSSAFGQVLNGTQQSGDEADIFHNSTSQNASSENRDILAATNTSEIARNRTSNDRIRKYPTESVSVMSITICLGLWTVVANSLPLIAIIRQERLHKPVYILMANLAASDILTGIVFVSMGGMLLFLEDTTTISTTIILRVRFTSVLLSGFSSAYGLMSLTAERYWFIVHGMSYVNNVTNDKCKVAIVIVWVWSVLLATLPNFDWNCSGPSGETCIPLGTGMSFNFVVAVLAFVFIPLAAIVFFNTRVLRCVWKQVNAIAAQEASMGVRPTTNRRSAITIVLITIMFLVGWLPLYVKMALFIKDVASLHKMLCFIILNSALNPVIYAFRLRDVRRGVAGLFVKCFQRPEQRREQMQPTQPPIQSKTLS